MDPLRNPLRESLGDPLREVLDEFDWWPLRKLGKELEDEEEEGESEDE